MGDIMVIIDLLKYILLGLVQGLTEPLPISSSGHVLIFEELLNIEVFDLNLAIIVNAGSLVAIMIVFWKDIIGLIQKSFLFLFKKKTEFKNDFMYSLMIVVAVIPAGLVGLLFKTFIDDYLTSLLVVGLSLLVTAVALHFVSDQAIENTNEDITYLDAITIGLFQVFALIPGISRSGSTMVGGLVRKVKFEDTMKFSFLLYIPISLATILLAVLDISDSSDPFILGYIGAFLASVFATYFAVKWFFKMVRKGNLKIFSIYCLSVGSLVIILSFIVG